MKEELSDEDIITALREVYIKDMLREEERRIQRRQKTIKMFVSALAAAAMLVAGIFLIKQSQPKYSDIAMSYIEQLDNQYVSRGDNDIAEQYFGVVKKLKDSQAKPDELLAEIAAFYNYLSQDSEMDQGEKDWYTINMNFFEALAHLRNNDFKNAEPLLRKVSDSNSKYAEMAKEILK